MSHFKHFKACGLFPKRLNPKKVDAQECAALLPECVDSWNSQMFLIF